MGRSIMNFIDKIWRRISHTKALDQSSGQLETAFFEFVYRVTYIAGLSSVDQSFIYLIYNYTIKISLVLLICGEIWDSFDYSLTLDAISAIINSKFIRFASIYRYMNMQYHKDIYKQLASSMDSPLFDMTTDKRKKLVEIWAQRNDRYLKLLLVLGNLTVATWCIYPLMDGIEYNLVVGVRFPFEFNTPSRYAIVYIAVFIAFHYTSQYIMVIDLIIQAHLVHLLCQFDVLCDCFEDVLTDSQKGFEGISLNDLILNKDFVNVYIKRLGALVKQHKILLSYTTRLRDTLKLPMLLQLVSSGTLICFVAFQMITTLTLNILMSLECLLFLGYNLFQFYNICLWCEEITEQSSKIGEAIYCSGWESGISSIPGIRSAIMLVIARANNPIVFTAGGMFPMSLNAFTALVKTSYSFLTVLLNFQHEKH